MAVCPVSRQGSLGLAFDFVPSVRDDPDLNSQQPVALGIAVSMAKTKKKDLPVIGWREWVSIPEWEITRIKAKVDTGARSSSIHVVNLEQFERDGAQWARFRVHPLQRKSIKTVAVEARVLETRLIRSSDGKATLRPVIVTNIKLMGKTWPVELTLASRDEMGFRMLLGREAIRRRFLVNPGSSFYGGQPKWKKKRITK